MRISDWSSDVCSSDLENGVGEADILVHDETNRTLATMLATMQPPHFPVALGVIYCDPAPTYESAVSAQIEQARTKTPKGDLNALLNSGHTDRKSKRLNSSH